MRAGGCSCLGRLHGRGTEGSLEGRAPASLASARLSCMMACSGVRSSLLIIATWPVLWRTCTRGIKGQG